MKIVVVSSPFCEILCDASSIEHSFISSHTLEDIGDIGLVPTQLGLYLNKNRNKSEVSRQKILQTHLFHSSSVDVQDSLVWTLDCYLAQYVDGKRCHGSNALMPALVGHLKIDGNKKRKRGGK